MVKEPRTTLTEYEAAVLSALHCLNGAAKSSTIAAMVRSHPKAVGAACHRMYFMRPRRVKRHVDNGTVTWEAVT